MTPIRAWREHLGLTQTEVARCLGISQSAYAQQEAKEAVRKVTRGKIAQALGIAPEQLAV
ncbi:MAG: helix-turn-helix transcriptional regulator [Gallionellaceae bacterium]